MKNAILKPYDQKFQMYDYDFEKDLPFSNSLDDLELRDLSKKLTVSRESYLKYQISKSIKKLKPEWVF